MKIVSAALALALALGVPALAEPPKDAKKDAQERPVPPAAKPRRAGAGGNGLVAVIDPETGRLRPPTSAEMQVLLAGQAPPSSGREPLVVVHADGSKTAYLDERFWSHVVVRRRPDGTLEELCLTGSTTPAAPARPTRYEEK